MDEFLVGGNKNESRFKVQQLTNQIARNRSRDTSHIGYLKLGQSMKSLFSLIKVLKTIGNDTISTAC
jgi:hypothetical protein